MSKQGKKCQQVAAVRQDRLNLLKIEIKKRKKGNNDKIQTGHNTNRQKVNVTKYKTDNNKF